LPGSTTISGTYNPLEIWASSFKGVWYMNVPARGGVKRTTKEPPGLITG
jgi:hypothetical protein